MLQFFLQSLTKNAPLKPVKLKVRPVTPTVVQDVEASSPPVKLKARAITPGVSSVINLETQPVKLKVRPITPTIIIGEVHLPLDPVKLKVRPVTPLIWSDIYLNPVKLKLRPMTPRIEESFAVPLEPVKLKLRPVTPQVTLDRSFYLDPIKLKARPLTPTAVIDLEVPLPVLKLKAKPLSPRVLEQPIFAPGPLLGGFKMLKATWISQNALRVTFRSSYGSRYHYQLYSGRCLIGVTDLTTQRSLVGQLSPSLWPTHLQLVAVDTNQRLTDYSANLPPRPYNRVKLNFTASGWPSDSKWIDVTAGTIPGGAVDSSNLIDRLLYDVDREYQVITDPLPGSGTWSFEIAGRDGKLLGGNLGTAAAISEDVLAHPPDVSKNSDGSRMTASVASSTATIDFTYPV